MKAKDIMSRRVVSASPGHSVAHVARIMLEHHVSGVPVIGDDGSTVGVITEGDLLRRTELNPAAPDSPGGSARDYVKTHAWKVDDVMSKQIIAIDEEADLGGIAEIMSENDIKRVLVKRGDMLVGIVSRADLLRGIVSASRDQTASGDDAIRLAITTRLRSDLDISLTRSGVKVTNGHVVLWGRVATEEERDAARVAAESVQGVRSVTNHLRIIGPYAREPDNGEKLTEQPQS